MAGVQQHLEQHAVRDLREQVAQLVVDDHGLAVPGVAALLDVVAGERLVETVRLVVVAGMLGTWVPWLEKVNTRWSPGFALPTMLVQRRHHVLLGRVLVGEHGDAARGEPELLQRLGDVVGVVDAAAEPAAPRQRLELVDADTHCATSHVVPSVGSGFGVQVSRDQHGVGPGVDDEREPGGVPRLAGCLAGPGGGDATSARRRAAPRRASPRRCATAARAPTRGRRRRPRHRRRGTPWRTRPRWSAAHRPARAWQALSTTIGPGRPFFAQAAFSLTVVAPRYCGSTVPPRLQPLQQQLRVEMSSGSAAPWPEKCSRSNWPGAQQRAYAGGRRGHLASPRTAPRGTACSCTGSVSANLGSRYAGHSDRALPARTRISLRREAAELPADQPALRQEARLLLARAVRRLEVHQLPGHERLVGVEDQVLHLRAVLPQVGLHVGREQLVEHLAPMSWSLRSRSCGSGVGAPARPWRRRRGSCRSGYAVLDRPGLEDEHGLAGLEADGVLVDDRAVGQLALEDVDAGQALELGCVDPGVGAGRGGRAQRHRRRSALPTAVAVERQRRERTVPCYDDGHHDRPGAERLAGERSAR